MTVNSISAIAEDQVISLRPSPPWTMVVPKGMHVDIG